MNQTLIARQQIYDHFQASSAMQTHFFEQPRQDAYAAYYTSMYLIQDTGEAVYDHLQRGFSRKAMHAYLEFWGVMQAMVIQQDAISELYRAVEGEKLNVHHLKAWNELRDKRNLCAGHPANRSHGQPAPQRAFMGRGFGNYASIKYEMWDAATRTMSHPAFNLSQVIGQYDIEAATILGGLLGTMKSRWP